MSEIMRQRIRRRWPLTPEQRFEAGVDKSAGSDSCWPWMKYRLPNGYGAFAYNRETRYAHRTAWLLTNGAIPEGKNVLHSCDNPCCCNPKHLFLGTQFDNVHDMIRKGRQARGAAVASRGNAKLSETQVLEIRALHAQGKSIRFLCDSFNTHPTTIYNIVKRITWNHI